jgi:FkbM family methyltransferase
LSSSVISPRVRTLVDLLRPITDRFTYTARCGVSAGLKRRGGLGFLPRAQTSEEIFVQNMNVSGKVVYDIGAYEGLFTIRFASRAKHVYTFEPHPWCQRQTSINVAANGFHNVSLLQVALGSDSSLAVLSYPENEPARASIDPDIQTVLAKGWSNLRSTSVMVWPLDVLVEKLKLTPPDVIKIDAEGAECDILEGARTTLTRYRPALYVELHGTGPRVRTILESMGYTVEQVDELHLYCVAK